MPETADAEKRLVTAVTKIAKSDLLLDEYRRDRDEALLDLAAAGWGYGRLAELLGVSKTRAQQLVSDAARRAQMALRAKA